MKTRQSNQARLFGAATALALMFGGTGSAYAYVAGTIPGGASNEGLVPVYGAGTTTRDGYFGANLYLVGGPTTITVEYFGAEAGFTNEFVFDGSTLFTTPGVGSVWGLGPSSPLGSASIANVSSGLLDFSFISDLGPVDNGSNPLNTPHNVNFFVSFTDDATATSGTSVDLWLDDNGAGDDDNHDDMMIRLKVDGGTLTTVPIPAAAWLFGSALMGMVGIGARRGRKA